MKNSQYYICCSWIPSPLPQAAEFCDTELTPAFTRWKLVKFGNLTPNSFFLSNCRGVTQNHTMSSDSGVRMFTLGWQEQKMNQKGLRRKGICISTSPQHRLSH